MVQELNLSRKKIWVAGAGGMVGSAIIRRFLDDGIGVLATCRQDIDLTDYSQVETFYQNNKPDIVILAAAKVGGIQANKSYPAEFISENLQIQQNVIGGAHRHSVEKLLFLGSSCIYPKDCMQPIKEEYLLTGPLEPTNEWYAIAKIAGVKLCQAYRRQYGCDFISAMPTNLYGPQDNFHPENSHVPAGLLRRFHEAKIKKIKKVSVWGTGMPFREFMYVDDLADACIFLLRYYSAEMHINVGTGREITIADFANLMKNVVGYIGDIEFDTSRPDGTLRKRLDVSKIETLGWKSKTQLKNGLMQYYEWYLGKFND